MVVAVEFKRRMASTSILGIVICKFSYWQEVCPVILFLIHKGPEVCLHCTVLSFGLAIGLKIKSCRKFSLDF